MQGSSSIFDPLGFITPVTIQAMVLLQELWKMWVDLDEPLEESLQKRWNKMVQEIREATELVNILHLYNFRRCQHEGPWGSCLFQAR